MRAWELASGAGRLLSKSRVMSSIAELAPEAAFDTLATDRCVLAADPKSLRGRAREFLPVVSVQDSVISAQSTRSIANRYTHFYPEL